MSEARARSPLQVEFTVEPFVAGERGAHGEAALEIVRSAVGVTVDDGPFGTTVTGEDAAVLQAVALAVERAMASGATRVSLQVSRATPLR